MRQNQRLKADYKRLCEYVMTALNKWYHVIDAMQKYPPNFVTSNE